MDRISSPEGHHAPMSPLQRPRYPFMRNREVPSESMYGRLNEHGLPIPAPTDSAQVPVPYQNFQQSTKGAPYEGSPGFRAHMGYPLLNRVNNAEHLSVSRSLPPVSDSTIRVTQMAKDTPHVGYSQGSYEREVLKAPQRKAHRATQACDQCRARKAKCDEGRPCCSHCKVNNLGCVYKEVPLHKEEKTTQLVLDRLSQIETRMEERANRIDEHFAKWQDQMQEQVGFNLAEEVRHTHPTVQEHPALPPSPVIRQDSPLKAAMPQTQDVSGSKFGQQLGAVDPRYRQKEAEGELSIPVEHTTAAHKLLMWPSIKRLIHPERYDEDYVMRLEEEHSLISIYGQGEISYTADNSQLPMDCESKGAQPGVNGAGQHVNIDIDEFGNLDLDATTARRYYDSYFKHMFKLHPFLMEGELGIKVDNFIESYYRVNNSPPSSVSSYAQPARNSPPLAKKRQSNENLSVRGELLEPVSNLLRPRVGKNINTALILLYLALGAICEAPAPLPRPVIDKKIDYLNQYIPAPLAPFNSPPPAITIYVTDTNAPLALRVYRVT
ncbi:transcriptional regulator family: Fungal Specific TF [Penicillium roqueforti]|nr:transcriptional regulator family: Fungal Specific TF [Penicillium roqueforti]KAI3127977.1 transcriptional regulator family: Fungal Specific TF [Penicillium roqueforti]KAI3152842.1 transcriptional regulator family: Fungal Specific TF [Penicillium roqueforti]